MSEHSPADAALDHLNDAQGQLRSAYRRVDDMYAGLSRASSALVEAELESRRAGLIGEGPLSGVALANAGQEMARVAARCEDAAEVGHQIQSHLRDASLAVQEAQVSVGQIDRHQLPSEQARDLAVLQARVEALAQVVGLAGPIAAATTRHVEAAGEVARRNSTLNLDQRAQVGEVLRIGNGVSVASGDLGRAAEADRHLDSVLASASTSAQRIVRDAEAIPLLRYEDRPTYPEILNLDPAQALRLGVEGRDAIANRERLARAQLVVAEALAVSERAYAGAHFMSEPNVPEPVCAHILVAHAGDMVDAVQDERFVQFVRDHMGLGATIEPMYDDWSDDPQPIFGKHEVFDPLQDDPRALGQLKETVDAVRAGVGVGPIDDRELRRHAGGPEASHQDQVDPASQVARQRMDQHRAPGVGASVGVRGPSR